MNNTINKQENSNNIINNHLSDFVNNKNSNFPSFNNLINQPLNQNINEDSINKKPNMKNLNENKEFFKYNEVNETFMNSKSTKNKDTLEKNHFSEIPSQSQTNTNLKTLNEFDSNYPKSFNFKNNEFANQNTYTIPNINSNYNNNLTTNSCNNLNINTHNNIINPNYVNSYNIHNLNSNDISKTSYDILSENNLRRSGSKLKKTMHSANRSFSRPTKEIYSKDSAAASRLNFERSLRNYEETMKEGKNDDRFNNSGNVNKRIFHNYMKNKGDLFDNRIYKKYDAEYESRKKSKSNSKNRLSKLT